MAQEKPNRLAELLHLLRKQVPEIRQYFKEWLAAVREQPALLWETTAIRYATYGVSVIVLAVVLTKLSGLFVPPPPASAKPAATTADYHVVCSDPPCGHHFVIHRKFGFRGFPVTCPQCKKETGMQARQCHSPTCRGRWVAPRRAEGGLICPQCGIRLE